MKNIFIAVRLFALLLLTFIGVCGGIMLYFVSLIIDPFMSMTDDLEESIANDLDDSEFSQRVKAILEWL